jgi:hypothetical protein
MRRPKDDFEERAGVIFLFLSLFGTSLLFIGAIVHSVGRYTNDVLSPIVVMCYIVGGLLLGVNGIILIISYLDQDIDLGFLFEKEGVGE